MTAGKTIVFVSHNFQEIDRVTSRALLLDRGKLMGDGTPQAVIADYFKLLSNRGPQERQQNGNITGPGNGSDIEIVGVDICGADAGSKYWFRTHDELRVCVRFNARQPFNKPVFRVQFYRSDGLFCYGTNTERHEIDLGRILGEGFIVLVFPDLGLLGGDYSVRVAVLSKQSDEIPLHQRVVSPGIHVESSMRDGGGVFAMRAEWRAIALPEN
jgi:Wzt C-terminal domain